MYAFYLVNIYTHVSRSVIFTMVKMDYQITLLMIIKVPREELD